MDCAVCGIETNTIYAGDICPSCWNGLNSEYDQEVNK